MCRPSRPLSSRPVVATGCTTSLRKRLAVVVCLGTAAVLPAPACAEAGATGVGGLIQLAAPYDCIEQDSTLFSVGAEGCADTVGRGMFGASLLAVSPDGRDVYATSGDSLTGLESNGLVELSRNSATGALTQFGCISETGAECDFKGEGLQGDEDIVISPDGSTVYVGSPSAGIDVFTRAADGSLSLAECFKRTSDSGDPKCTPLSELEGARGLALSPDGQYLYAAEQNGNAIATFARTGAGKIVFTGCISEEAKGGLSGCAYTTAVGLYGVTGLAVSPDGERVYAVSYTDDALVTFTRMKTGALVYVSCESSGAGSGCPATKAGGLESAQNVVVSPDGSRIYVVTLEGDLSTFTPTSGGTSEVGCLSAKGADPTCTPAGANLEGGADLVLAPPAVPGGGELYTVSFFARTVNAFSIDSASGLPIALPGADACIQAATSTAGCAVLGHGLDSADGIAASPDGQNVYVASRGEDAVNCGAAKCTDTIAAVASFLRAPVPPVPSGGGGGGGTPPPLAPAHPPPPALGKPHIAPATIHRKGHGAKSAVLTYTDTEVAIITISVEAARTGVRRHGRCVKGHARTHSSRCVYESVLTTFTHKDAAGANAIVVRTTIGHLRLAPGRYLLVLVSSSPSGISRPVSVTLRVV